MLSFAALAHVMGAPELLGGFAAGIALSRRFFLPMGLTFRVDPKFNRQIYEQMKPIIHLFTPIFFVMVGLSLDLSAVDWGSGFIWWFSLSIAFVAILGKLLGGVLVKGNPWARVAMGMAMVPRGEVGLIFAELGRVSGIFDNEVYAGTVIVIAYTTLAYDWLREELTTDLVKEHFKEVCFGEVERFELPNLLALNFVLHDVLGGGGSRSLRVDAQGKALGQAMLQLLIPAPSAYVIEEALRARASGK